MNQELVALPQPASASPSAGLLDAASAGRLVDDVGAAARLVAGWFTEVERPFTGRSTAPLRREIGGVDVDRPLAGLDAVLEEVEQLYLRDAVWFHHPRYVAHLNCPVALPAVVGDLVATAVNSSLDTWDQSAGATFIERRLVDWTAARLGLGPTADGIFTSGGSQSNLQAMLLARGHAVAAQGGDLETALPRLRILASDVSHFSIRKAAAMLGLGRDGVVEVATDDRRRMDLDDLARQLADLEERGLVPMAVVATAGTTDFGSIDPMIGLADLSRASGAWVHVDAAYGGGLVTSTRNRHLLAGIDRADSVTVDFHKTFFQPVASSALLVRDADTLRHVTFHADYLNPHDADADARPNQVDKSLQTTRRFDALKLWFTLRSLGPDRIGEMLDAVLDLADEGWRLLAGLDDFEVLVRPTLSTLVFRWAPPGLDAGTLDRVNRAARERLFATGEAVVAGTRVDGRDYLKLTLLNPATTRDDLITVLDLVRGHAHAALEEVPSNTVPARRAS